MQPHLPLERALQVPQSRLMLADGAATQSLERSQLLQLLPVDPVSFLRDGAARAGRRREHQQVICHSLFVSGDTIAELAI